MPLHVFRRWVYRVLVLRPLTTMQDQNSAMQNVIQIALFQRSKIYMTTCWRLANNSWCMPDVQLTQSPSLGACPMPISSNVLGPLPAAEEADEAGLGGVGVAGLFACTGAGFGGGCCCCNVCTLLGLGMLSYPLGRPDEPGREEGREPCPGVVVEGLSILEEVLLSWPG